MESVWHRATLGYFEDEDGEVIRFCYACGKQCADIGTGVTPRHKGVTVRDLPLRIYNRKGICVAIMG